MSLSQAHQQTSTGVLSQQRRLELFADENHKIPTYRTPNYPPPHTGLVRRNPPWSFNPPNHDLTRPPPLPHPSFPPTTLSRPAGAVTLLSTVFCKFTVILLIAVITKCSL